MKPFVILLWSVACILILGLFSFDILSPGDGTVRDGITSEEKTLTVGYCPTMSFFAERIADRNDNVKATMYTETADTLQKIHSGVIDIALVGRIAKADEAGDAHEMRISNGYTLIGSSKRFIHEEELGDMEIHTALPKNEIESFVPEAKNIVYHSSLQEAIASGMNNAVLINWDDYDGTYELVIPHNDNRKVMKFRIPVMYSVTYDEEQMRRLL